MQGRVVAESQSQAEARLVAVMRELGSQPGVTHRMGAGLERSVLKVHDKIFATVSSQGHLVVKLPKTRIDALVDGNVWQRFEANGGWPENEWLECRSQSSSAWLTLAREALAFVGT